ncbi:MAG: flagellar motor switch protein FliM [Pirellulales bacterium]|nr:flagellar motor switch protein FliM [Pirellulales bacterium]
MSRMTPDHSPDNAGSSNLAQRDQLLALRAMHKSIAEALAARLSRLLNHAIAVRLTDVDATTHLQFVNSLERPTFVCRLGADESRHKLALEINHSILYPLLDCLLGGDPTAQRVHIPHRPLTDIERRLAARVVGVAVEVLTAGWESNSREERLGAKCLPIECVASNPAQTRVAGDDEQVVLITFEVELGPRRGMLNLCLPWPAITAFVGELPQPFVPDACAAAADCAGDDSHPAQACGALVELVVEVDAGHISRQDLQALATGDIITTSQAADDPLVASVDGKPEFLVRPGSLGGQRAIEVIRPVGPQEADTARRAG